MHEETPLSHQRQTVQIFEGEGMFTQDGWLESINDISEIKITQAIKEESSSTHESIWESFQQVLNKVPKETIETLPMDGASEIDHYLYGTPKKHDER